MAVLKLQSQSGVAVTGYTLHNTLQKCLQTRNLEVGIPIAELGSGTESFSVLAALKPSYIIESSKEILKHTDA